MAGAADGVWYYKTPLGVNTLGPILKTISTNAGLSKVYTPHSIRATVVMELHEGGFNLESIAKVTGNKNFASVQRYTHRGRKRDSEITKMSGHLTTALSPGIEGQSEVATASGSSNVSVSVSAQANCVTSEYVGRGSKSLKIRAHGDSNIVEFVFK